jgi:hypothetical protein
MPPAKRGNRSPSPRTHIVLVPGFAGFDALGQMEYYAGVTPIFRAWQQNHPAAVLHYFDNFPTAAVKTRAQRLRNYLAKRIARGEFVAGDPIALVGHSTAGLDIRQLVMDLAAAEKCPDGCSYAVDGTYGTKFTVTPSEILGRIHRVVFLSVPHFGTNIADWVRLHAPGRYAVIAELRAAVTTSQIPLLDQLQSWLTGALAQFSNLDLFYAVQDALAEAQPPVKADAMRRLSAQEDASQLALYLRHIFTDFAAINDLSAEPYEGRATSPAHFDAATRAQELQAWKDHGISAYSYATLGSRPFRFDLQNAAPRWELIKPWTYPEITPSTNARFGADIVYRAVYRACAGGPFEYPDLDMSKPPVLVDAKGVKHEIAIWDNDGIVNTASMIWDNPKPHSGDIVLVQADHADIIGHFNRELCPHPDCGRKYDVYDLLKSGSGFDSTKFAAVWKGVFGYCVG